MSKETVWIITSEWNLYDQQGEYFIQAYKNRPTHRQCLDFLLNVGVIQKYQDKGYQEKMAECLMNGEACVFGDVCYNLKEEELK